MKKNRLLIISILIFMFVAAITGCGSSNTTQSSPNSAQSSTPATTADKSTVKMQDFKFQPAEITINKGETVTWINQDSAGHDVVGSSFKSDVLQKGQSFQQTFNETGTFDYSCPIHPGMTGKVIVK